MNTTKKLCKWLHKPTSIKTSRIVIQKIKKLYKEQGIHDIDIFPHHTFWNRKHYGVKVPIFRKLTDSWEDQQYSEYIESMEEYYLDRLPVAHKNLSKKESKELFLAALKKNKKEREIYRKGQALSKYIEVFEKLKMGNCFENYCDLITTIIGDSQEYLLYDIIVDQKCEQQRADLGELNLELSYGKVMDIDDNSICEWFDKAHLIYYDMGSSLSEKTAFEQFARNRINEISFPYKFKMYADKKVVTIEKAYKEIQLELIYSTALRNLFKRRKYNGILSAGLSMYKFEEICERINPIFTVEISSDSEALEEYTYIIEKITGVNLAVCFSKYYTEIKRNSQNIILESQQEYLLFGILNELIDMPNVFSRIQILKEYMESVIFWTGDLTKKLYCVGNSLKNLKNSYSKDWTVAKDTFEKEKISIPELLECCKFDLRENIKQKRHPSYPFIFVDTKHLHKHNDFDIICKHIINRIFHYNKN